MEQNRAEEQLTSLLLQLLLQSFAALFAIKRFVCFSKHQSNPWSTRTGFGPRNHWTLGCFAVIHCIFLRTFRSPQHHSFTTSISSRTSRCGRICWCFRGGGEANSYLKPHHHTLVRNYRAHIQVKPYHSPSPPVDGLMFFFLSLSIVYFDFTPPFPVCLCELVCVCVCYSIP